MKRLLEENSEHEGRLFAVDDKLRQKLRQCVLRLTAHTRMQLWQHGAVVPVCRWCEKLPEHEYDDNTVQRFRERCHALFVQQWAPGGALCAWMYVLGFWPRECCC